jgi:hypothetical protein
VVVVGGKKRHVMAGRLQLYCGVNHQPFRSADAEVGVKHADAQRAAHGV